MERSDIEVEVPANSGIAGSASAAPVVDGASGANGATAALPESVETGKLNAAKHKLGVAKEKVVDRMHATADWIKEKDVDAVKGGIEQQVRDHPGRTLLIAVGLGYLIGRAFRGNGA
jgi:ElaB/YqjD/DUF883 family membrane-anchored ribosome-binding protein